MRTTAQGTFVVFTIRVSNIGQGPQYFSAQNQKLIDTDGRQYSASADADLNLNKIAALGLINPGNSVEVEVAFDVQPDIRMNALELRDSAYSAGVKFDPAVG